jgi:chitodextrinase
MRKYSIIISQIFFLLVAGSLGILPQSAEASDLVINRVTVSEEPKTTQGGVVKITWYTNLEADGRVDYGLTTGYGSYIASSLAPSLYHEIILAGLKSETTYHFKITSSTPWGQRLESFDQTFKTTKFKDTTVPVISNARVSYIGGSYFILTWQTDEPTDSNLEYSTSDKMVRPSRASGKSNTTVHEVVVTKLKPSVVYWYQVRARDKDRNETVWGPFSLTTAPGITEEKEILTLTQISPVSSPDTLIGDTAVTFHWRTSRPARGWVEMRSKKKGSKKVEEKGFYTTEHELTITGLVKGVTYTTKLQATDVLRNSVTSGEIYLTTGAITSPVSNGSTPNQPSSPNGMDNCGPSYAYGASCRDLSAERNLAKDLKLSLLRVFAGRTPAAANQNWYTLVKAYVYGGYPLEAITKAIKHGGKTVHPTIPWSAWRNSAEYKEYIKK